MEDRRDSLFALRAKASAVTPVLRLILAIALIVPGILPAQTAGNSASIAGKVREENGTAVRAIVTATSGAFVERAFAGNDGAFQFSKLPAGSYSLCAQTSSMGIGPKEDPYGLSTGDWHSSGHS